MRGILYRLIFEDLAENHIERGSALLEVRNVQDPLQNNGEYPDSQRGEDPTDSRDYSKLTEEKLQKPNNSESLMVI